MQSQHLTVTLARLADDFGTPLYVYDCEEMVRRFADLRALFGRHFGVSYAVKANPNIELLKRILPHVETLDVSSFGEVERALAAGCPPSRITFSGPAKRNVEVRSAIAARIGELVLESTDEAEIANFYAAEMGVHQNVLIRFNPSTNPKHFGVSFSGRASQFGIDEEAMGDAIDQISRLPHLKLVGFHIYSGTNSLRPSAIVDNFAIFIDIFRRAAASAKIAPQKLVFGSGFGLPYGSAEAPLDITAIASPAGTLIDGLKTDPMFANASCVLEMGRWLVGPVGWLLTTVVREKHSRGVEIRACDAGFNNHLAACGMMGTVIRRNWRFDNITNPNGSAGTYTLVGPLCTSIDVLATDIVLAKVRSGDVLAVHNSGAYGYTASPGRFISHPEPSEILLTAEGVVDGTEHGSRNNFTIPDQQFGADNELLVTKPVHI